MNSLLESRWLPVVMLTCSNIFMTFAWYGHLKFKDKPLWIVILASWGIAFLEYCFQVPANRWGSNMFSPYQLKIMQEVITLAGVRLCSPVFISRHGRHGIISRHLSCIAAAGGVRILAVEAMTDDEWIGDALALHSSFFIRITLSILSFHCEKLTWQSRLVLFNWPRPMTKFPAMLAAAAFRRAVFHFRQGAGGVVVPSSKR